jgi:hypothetical protein
MLFFILVFSLNYEMADDSTYSGFIANECYNFNYMNYYLCAFIGFIQNIIYPINAFVIVCLVFSCLSFIAITRVFLDKFNMVIATCITLFINGFFAVNHYETISFTRMPTLLTVAGFLCVIHYVEREKWKLGTIVGGLFVIIGSAFRFKIFEVSVVFAVLFVIGKSLTEYFSNKENKSKIANFFKLLFAPRRLIVAVIVVGVCFAINIASNLIIKSDEDVSYYIEYTNARSAVWDYSIPDYSDCKEEYDAINIDENDIEMLRSGYMDDDGAFTLEQLYNIKGIQNKYNAQTNSYTAILKEMIVSEISNIKAIGDKGIACFAFCMVLLLYLLIMRKRKYFIPLLFLGATFVFYYYLWITGKVPFRAVYVLWFSSIIYLLYSFSFNESRDFIQHIYIKRKKIFLSLLCCGSVVVSLIGLYLSNVANDHIETSSNKNNGISATSDYISNHKENKYIFTRKVSVIGSGSNDIYYVSESDKNINYQSFNCTYGELPYIKEQVKNFGTDNMYSFLLEDNVYLVDNNDCSQLNMFVNYLQKYYSNGKTVDSKLVYTVDNNNIYKIFVKKEDKI